MRLFGDFDDLTWLLCQVRIDERPRERVVEEHLLVILLLNASGRVVSR